MDSWSSTRGVRLSSPNGAWTEALPASDTSSETQRRGPGTVVRVGFADFSGIK